MASDSGCVQTQRVPTSETFTMETAEKIRKEVMPDTWATSVDLTDAYHHLPIYPDFQNFLTFEVAGVNYKYVACPFGLSPILQVFYRSHDFDQDAHT